MRLICYVRVHTFHKLNIRYTFCMSCSCDVTKLIYIYIYIILYISYTYSYFLYIYILTLTAFQIRYNYNMQQICPLLSVCVFNAIFCTVVCGEMSDHTVCMFIHTFSSVKFSDPCTLGVLVKWPGGSYEDEGLRLYLQSSARLWGPDRAWSELSSGRRWHR